MRAGQTVAVMMRNGFQKTFVDVRDNVIIIIAIDNVVIAAVTDSPVAGSQRRRRQDQKRRRLEAHAGVDGDGVHDDNPDEGRPRACFDDFFTVYYYYYYNNNNVSSSRLAVVPVLSIGRRSSGK